MCCPAARDRRRLADDARAHSLGVGPDPEEDAGIRAALDGLDDPDPSQRASTVNDIYLRCARQYAPHLLDRLEREQDPEPLAALLFTLALLDVRDAIP